MVRALFVFKASFYFTIVFGHVSSVGLFFYHIFLLFYHRPSLSRVCMARTQSDVGLIIPSTIVPILRCNADTNPGPMLRGMSVMPMACDMAATMSLPPVPNWMEAICSFAGHRICPEITPSAVVPRICWRRRVVAGPHEPSTARLVPAGAAGLFCAPTYLR